MSVTAEIQAKLSQAFATENVQVIDESEGHRGHAGYKEGGESHFRVVLTATGPLKDMTRLARHRAVHDALGPDILSRIHALAIQFD